MNMNKARLAAMFPTGSPLITVRNLSKRYATSQAPALRQVTFGIGRGEFVALIGRSGSGKSTLLHVLAGLEPPDTGEIIIGNLHVEKMSQGRLSKLRREYFGFVFQSFALLPHYTAGENVALPLAFAGVEKKRRLNMAAFALEQVGLGDLFQRRPDQMSGGQQQRTAIARALVGGPQILLADEPTGNLDSQTGGEIIGLLKHLQKKRRLTLILATHDLQIASLAQRTLEISDGIIRQSPGKENKNSENDL